MKRSLEERDDVAEEDDGTEIKSETKPQFSLTLLEFETEKIKFEAWKLKTEYTNAREYDIFSSNSGWTRDEGDKFLNRDNYDKIQKEAIEYYQTIIEEKMILVPRSMLTLIP